MEKIVYRKASLEDLPVLLKFEQQIIATERPWDPTLKDGHINYYDLREKILEEDSEVIVATVGDEVVSSGYVSIRIPSDYFKHDRYAYMGFMYVRPEQRGRGVIRGLIDVLNDWVRAHGISEVRLEVYSENEAALRAYEKAGFKSQIVEMRMGL